MTMNHKISPNNIIEGHEQVGTKAEIIFQQNLYEFFNSAVMSQYFVIFYPNV